MSDVVILVGAVRAGRLSNGLQAAAAQLPSAEVVSLSDLTLGFADGTPMEARTDDSAKLFEAVAQASKGIVLATPVYHGSFTGALKNALDLLPADVMTGKKCAVITMADKDGHGAQTAAALGQIIEYLGGTPAKHTNLGSAHFQDGKPTEATLAELKGILESAL